jgi:hypothetical protein
VHYSVAVENQGITKVGDILHVFSGNLVYLIAIECRQPSLLGLFDNEESFIISIYRMVVVFNCKEKTQQAILAVVCRESVRTI